MDRGKQIAHIIREVLESDLVDSGWKFTLSARKIHCPFLTEEELEDFLTIGAQAYSDFLLQMEKGPDCYD